MRTASIVLNAVNFTATCLVILSLFRKDGKWDIQSGLHMFRFFTVLSNAFCGLASLLMAVSQLSGDAPAWILHLKYLGTVSVTLTFLTVFLFLIPFKGGAAKWMSGPNIYMHLLGPLLAIGSYVFLEKRPMSLAAAMTGLLPLLVYGSVYLYKVMFAPEGHRWEDVYGLKNGGNWLPSALAMGAGTAAICYLFQVI